MNELYIRQLQMAAAKNEIRCCSALNRLYGLTLTEEDITELVELRGQALRNTGRVEFGGGILPKLIRAFCKSPYPKLFLKLLTASGADLQAAAIRLCSVLQLNDEETKSYVKAITAQIQFWTGENVQFCSMENVFL